MYKLFLLIFLFTFSIAKTLVVDDDYYDRWTGTICEHGTRKWGRTYYDYHTITEALVDAEDGDIVKICPGSYNESNLIINKNIVIESTQTTNINDVIIYDNSNTSIFNIQGWRDGVSFLGFEIQQNSSNKNAIDIEYGNNYNFSDLNIISKGGGIIQNSGSFQNSIFENVNIDSSDTSLYFDAPQNLSLYDLNLTSKTYGVYINSPQGNILVDRVNKTNFINSQNTAFYIGDASQDYDIKYFDFYSKYAQGIKIINSGVLNIYNGKIVTDSLSGIRVDLSNSELNVSNVDILVNNTSNKNLYIKQGNKVYVENSTFDGAKYGIYIENSYNGGIIKNNIFKNASYKGLQIFNEPLWRGYQVINNCFENGEDKNILSQDKSGYFDSNYYDDWSGSGAYEIPNIPKYDNNPWAECNVVIQPHLDVSVLLNYRMDECEWDGSIGDVKDSSENVNNGTSKNANTESNETLDGMIGRVGNFIDGNSSILTDVSLPSEYTLTMWIKFPLDESNHIDFSGRKYFNIADVPTSNSDYIYFRNYDGDWALCMFGDTYECQDYNPQNLVGWHFVTFKVSTNDTKFYVDNNLKLTFSQHPNNVNLGLLFNSDYSADDNVPNGQSIGADVDEFKIFTGLIADEDLETIYNNELNRKNYDGSEREDIDCTGQIYQVCYQTNFSNQIEIDENWTIIKNQNYTPQVYNQRLRLTKNSNDIATGLTLKDKIFKANGTKFKIKFKHYAYDGSSSKGADGIAVVFSDANIEPVAGAFGGSLGYAQRDTPSVENGFSGGWIGIGLDEYGNYSNPTEGRVGGPGFTPQAVAIRGSYLEEYKYLTGTNSLTPSVSDGDSSTPSPGYTYEIRVDTTQTDKTIISVYRDTGSGSEVLINNYEYNTSNTPDYFRFSLTGSTGGENNIHEIDDLEILALDCNNTLLPPSVLEENNFYVKELDRNDRNITTKIVNKSFVLEITSDTNFTGTVCSAVVDNNENNISSWFKNYFDNTDSSNNTNEGNPSYKVDRAIKNSRIKIEWLKDVDVACPLDEYNSTLSTDNFAIRPKNFEIDFSSLKIYAGGDFSITFRALDENGNNTKDYNETNSFEVNATEIKPQCKNGDFNVDVSFSNGESNSVANYSEIGEINISIRDLNFASVDSDDTPINDRVILPASIQTISYPYSAKTITTFSDKNIIYIDKDLNRFAEINVTIDMLNKQNQIVKNFDRDCYSDDINISFNVSNNIIDSFKGMFDIDGIEKNDSKFETFNNKFEINKSLFFNGEHNLSIKFNIYKNRAYPVSIVDLNFSKTILDYPKAPIQIEEILNKQLSFYYLSLFVDDIITSEKNSSTLVDIIVYDRNKNHFTNEKLLYWFVDTNYNEDDVKILGYTSGFKYDTNLTNFNVSLDKIVYDYNLSIENLNQTTFGVIHYKTPSYLWYSKYKDYNDSIDSYCISHYCSEYIYKPQDIIVKDVGSGKFQGSEVNITKPKTKRFGIKIYR